ncbi:MAG: DUF4388 domain-containing protein [Thermodesulfobacteriota bacterium]
MVAQKSGSSKTGAPKAVVKIIGTDECPLYRVGDTFKVAGKSLFAPYGKPTCLVLVGDITEVLLNYSSRDSDTRYVFDCGGCTGMVRLEYRKEKVEDLARADGSKEPSDQKEEGYSLAGWLSNYAFFQTLDEQNIREIVSILKKKQYPAGATVIEKGDSGKNLYIIVSGRVEVLGENDIRIARLGKGEIFGEMSLISGDPVIATVKAVEPLTVLYLNGKYFGEMMQKSQSIQIYMTRLLARRIASANISRSREIAAGLTGNLSEIPPNELLQTLHQNQKTGMLLMKMSDGLAAVSFREGKLIRAKYGDKEDEAAFFEILKAREGRFKFNPELPPEETRTREIGNFLKLLMEGARRMDEENAPSP